MSLAAEPFLPRPAREAIVRHAVWCQPEEACGLIAVKEGRVQMVYCLTNAERSFDRFTIAPDEHFGALMHAERRGWEIGGVFHSHPHGGASLSPVDLAQPHDPDWFHLVVGFRPLLHLRGWRIDAGRPRPIALPSTPGHTIPPASAPNPTTRA